MWTGVEGQSGRDRELCEEEETDVSAWVLAGGQESSAPWDVESALHEESLKKLSWPMKVPYSESEYRTSTISEVSQNLRQGEGGCMPDEMHGQNQWQDTGYMPDNCAAFR